jgi:putative methionine-R-sulfoxide reductase with GAF domain
MKRIFLVATGIALCFGLVPAIGHARTLLPPPFQGSYEKSQEATKTFSGTVMKQGDIYILSDKADKTNYQLVDSKKLSEFIGKNVKVTGTLDAENLTIHVQNIQEIA